MQADQFGEQTYYSNCGKGAEDMKGISTSTEQVAAWVNSFSMCTHLDIAEDMKGISTSTEQVAAWVNSFSVCTHLDIAVEQICTTDGEEQNKHKE